jgi:hypothetical protein
MICGLAVMELPRLFMIVFLTALAFRECDAKAFTAWHLEQHISPVLGRWTLRETIHRNFYTDSNSIRNILDDEVCTPHELAAARKIELRKKRAKERNESGDPSVSDSFNEEVVGAVFKACKQQRQPWEDRINEQINEHKRIESMTKSDKIYADTKRYNLVKQAAAAARGAAGDAVAWAAETLGIGLQPGTYEYEVQEMMIKEAPSYDEDDAYGPENAGSTFSANHKATQEQSMNIVHFRSKIESNLDFSVSTLW